MVRLIFFFMILNLHSASVFGDTLINGSKGSLISARIIAEFYSPWAMTFISKSQILVSSKEGKLWLVSTNGEKVEVTGVPSATVAGQGGLGDIVVHPNFKDNGYVYLSLVEKKIDDDRYTGAVVYRAKLNFNEGPALTNLKLIWVQLPKVQGSGHFSHKLVFGPVGSEHEGKLFISSGDRQKQLPAQSFNSGLGKIIRINEDGTVPTDNPFQDDGGLAKTFWSLGHRNILGIAFDNEGRLWANEMGPRHGDELNFIVRGENYGWPLVSEGNHYNGKEIPRHNTQPKFIPPKLYWVPTIAPSGLFFYSGEQFVEWKGHAFMGGLRSKALIRVKVENLSAVEAERFKWGSRIREVEQGPDGSIWVLEDAPSGRLIQLFKP